MTHWYRLPNPISVGRIFLAKKQTIFIDHGLSSDLAKHLPSNAVFLPQVETHDDGACEGFIRLCQEKHAVLVTANEEYALALPSDSTGAWGIILLPSEVRSQIGFLIKLSAGDLTFRPTKENTDIIEYARRNRMLLDGRRDPPILSIHSQCRWRSETAAF
jgi:hypothetical protein